MDISLLGFSGLFRMFNTHPVFVHFPIAFIPAALALYLLGAVFKDRRWFFAGQTCLVMGALGAVVAVVTGLRAEGSIPHNQQIHDLMQVHKTIGWTILVLIVLLVLWSFWKKNERPAGFWTFFVGLVFATYLVLQNGDLGGRMVFLEGAAVKPAVPVITGKSTKEATHPSSAQPSTGDSHDHGDHDHAH